MHTTRSSIRRMIIMATIVASILVHADEATTGGANTIGKTIPATADDVLAPVD